jgi:hypothetical protein
MYSKPWTVGQSKSGVVSKPNNRVAGMNGNAINCIVAGKYTSVVGYDFGVSNLV